MQFTPDWSRIMTPKDIEGMFNSYTIPVSFKGPGFYLTETDTLLVVPNRPDETTPENIWHCEQPEGALYIVHIWNTKFQNLVLSVIALAPNRLDERKLFKGEGAKIGEAKSKKQFRKDFEARNPRDER